MRRHASHYGRKPATWSGTGNDCDRRRGWTKKRRRRQRTPERIQQPQGAIAKKRPRIRQSISDERPVVGYGYHPPPTTTHHDTPSTSPPRRNRTIRYAWSGAA